MFDDTDDENNQISGNLFLSKGIRDDDKAFNNDYCPDKPGYGNYYDLNNSYQAATDFRTYYFRPSTDCGPTPNATVITVNSTVTDNWTFGGTIATYDSLTEGLGNAKTYHTVNVTLDSGPFIYDAASTKPTIVIYSPNITLDCGGTNLSGPNDNNGDGIYFMQNNITIRNCSLQDFDHAIWVDYLANNSLIRGNTFLSNYENGIYFDTQYTTYYDHNITFNLFNGTEWSSGEDIHIRGGNHTISYNNFSSVTVTSNIEFITATHAVVSNNRFKDCGTYCINLNGASDYGKILNNRINSSKSYGLYLLSDSDYHLIRGNNFTNHSATNGAGIGSQSSGSGTQYDNITENLFQDNYWHIRLDDNNDDFNNIWKNNFMNNVSTNVEDDGAGNFYNLSNIGNYWAIYDSAGEGCNDANNNGRCDSAFTADDAGNAVDNFPFTTQDGWYLPVFNTVECFNTTAWTPCANIKFNNTIEAVRVNCTSVDATVNNATFELVNNPDSSTKYNTAFANLSSADYWIFNSTNLLIQDSGVWNWTIICNTTIGSYSSNYTTWTVPWGTLSVTWISPTGNSTVSPNMTSDFQVNVSCIDGECGDINLTLDPEQANPKPIILDAYVKPTKVKVGDKMQVFVHVQDNLGIESVIAEMPYENGKDIIKLSLTNGTIYDGLWEQTWKVHNTKPINYTTLITITNNDNQKIYTEIVWEDPTITNGDFETGNLTGWSTGGNQNWTTNTTFVQEGSYSAQAGKISTNQITWINQSVTLTVNGTLTFFWKVSSETNYDFLLFCNNTPACTRTSGFQDRISGSVDWTMQSYNLSNGTHILHWAYAKDGSGNTANDTGFVDNITITLSNTGPSVNSVSTSPSPFSNGYNVTCKANVTDPDSDTIQYVNFTIYDSNGGMYVNNVNGTSNGDLWNSSYFVPNATGIITCNLTAYDGITTTTNSTTFYSGNKTGAISTTIGAIPFYTTSSNPQTCQNLKSGNSCNKTWTVNATGKVSSTWEFYAIADAVNYSNVISVEGSKINITITDLSEPTIIIDNPVNNTNLTAGTTWSWMNITTNEPSICQFNKTNDFTFGINGTYFSSNDNISHFFNYSSLSSGPFYTTYYRCNDTSGNTNTLPAAHTFGVHPTDITSPTVTLLRPLDASTLRSNLVQFNFTPFDFHLDSCVLWTNTTGIWKKNTTVSSPTNNSNNSVSLNITDGYYLWNVVCNDTSNNNGTASNYSFTFEALHLNISISLNQTSVSPNASVLVSGYLNLSDGTNISNHPVDVYLNGTKLTTNNSYLGDGSDGSIIIDSANTVVNNYTHITTNETAGSIQITVSSSSQFSVGDEILVIQMQDKSCGTSAGTYEFTNISVIDGNNINITSPLQNTYCTGAYEVVRKSTVSQIVKVPHYTDVIVNSGASLRAGAWAGYSGGILVFRALGTVNVLGSINANSRGFRGGRRGESGQDAYQGESYRGKGDDSQSAAANLGGGGDANADIGCAAGGGGAGYATSGTAGGNCNAGAGGSGGATYGNVNLSVILLGSGGGGGEYDSDTTVKGGAGGAGGGIVMLFANNITATNTSSITSKGTDGVTTNRAGGGGGSGGSIYLAARYMALSNSTNASGGAGGGTSPSGGNAGHGRIRLDYIGLTGSSFPGSGYNGTFNSTFTTNDIGYYNYTITAPAVTGTYEVKVNTTYTNYTAALNTTLTVSSGDEIKPTINFTYPTTNTGNYSQTWIALNITAADDNFSMVVGFLYNTTALVNATNITSTTLYFNVTSLPQGTYYINATANDTSNNTNSTETRTIVLDTTNPLVTITKNDTLVEYGSESINVSWTVTDSTALATVLFNITYPNNSMIFNSTSSTGFVNLNTSNLTATGRYNISVWGNDTTNQLNVTTDSFTVNDTIAPTINFTTVTTTTGNYSQTWITANITASDYALGTLNITLYNSTALVNSTSLTSSPLYINFTNLADTSYYLNATVNDTSGNLNSTETRNISLDNTIPFVLIAKNDSMVEFGVDVINISWTSSDAIALNSTLFNITNISNSIIYSSTSASGLINLSLSNLTIEGIYVVNLWSIDTVGQTNFTNTSFTVNDTSAPVVTLVAPTNNSGDNDGNLSFVYNVTDGSAVNNCTLSINNVSNQTNNTITKNSNQTFTLNNLPIAQYNWTINCTDTLNNTGTSQVNKFVVVETINFTGNTTNLNQVNISNITNLIVDKPNYGMINITESVDLSNGTNITQHVNISHNRIEINTTALPQLNKSATLYLRNLSFANPRILKDDVACSSTICTVISYSSTTGILAFNVTQFSAYSAEDYCGNSNCEATESCSTCSADCGSCTTTTPTLLTAGSGGFWVKDKKECDVDSDCEPGFYCWENKCAILFDIKITKFYTKLEPGKMLNFTYLIKGMGHVKGDVIVSYWLEKDDEIVSSGQDTIYLGKYEQKNQTSEIVIPSNINEGTYSLHVGVDYLGYKAESQRLIEIVEGKVTIIEQPSPPPKPHRLFFPILQDPIKLTALLILLTALFTFNEFIHAVIYKNKKTKRKGKKKKNRKKKPRKTKKKHKRKIKKHTKKHKIQKHKKKKTKHHKKKKNTKKHKKKHRKK